MEADRLTSLSVSLDATVKRLTVVCKDHHGWSHGFSEHPPTMAFVIGPTASLVISLPAFFPPAILAFVWVLGYPDTSCL